MKVSLQWIRDLLPALKTNASGIEKRLTQAGVEVDGMVQLRETLQGVVSAEVRELAPHPNADALQLATIFDGTGEQTVVCGAPNVQKGQRVAFAPEGTTLPVGITLSRRKIRGVESAGMICSEAELGLVQSSEGILVLKPRTRPGKPIADALDLKREVLFDCSVTPNRPDVLSHIGVARELAALHRLAMPKVSCRVREGATSAASQAKIEVKAPDLCPRYIGRVIKGVEIGPSPVWLQRRLHSVGIRSISNVVDATNLVLMELGHPLHAFDLDKLHGKKIVVRRAARGEKIKTLDDVERSLDKNDLVIADASQPIAIAGVMGGVESEVGPGTTDLLLESALFDPSSVRKTAKRHALHTEASHRFERGTDRAMVETAIDRCASLIVELAGGEVQKGRLDVAKAAPSAKPVPIRVDRASRLLGKELTRKEVREALVALGLKSVRAPASPGKKRRRGSDGGLYADALHFEIPSWRVDLHREEDLIEEVARMIGYDAIPTVMPPGSSAIWTGAPQVDHDEVARRCLVAEGFHEAISLAFNSADQVEALGLSVDQAVALANPLGEESALMRLSLVPALLKAARLNQDNLPSRTDLRLFEIGRIFAWASKTDKLPVETPMVAYMLRGRCAPRSWHGDGETVDAYDVKATAERLLQAFLIRDAHYELVELAWLHPRSATRVSAGGEEIGVFGEVHPAVLERFGIEGPPVFVGAFHLARLEACRGGLPAFRPLPKFPPAQRDLSFFVDASAPAAGILGVIRGAAAEHLESLEIFDVYVGKGVPDGKKSLAVSMVFRRPEGTMTDAEVDGVQSTVVRALDKKFGATLRSS